MKTFKQYSKNYLYKYQVLASITLFVFMTSLSAEVAVNHIEKNDKVSDAATPVSTQLTAQPQDSGLHTWALRAEQWEFARSGESVLSLPVLNSLINAWLLDKQKMIEIQYPGGEEGEFWVHELSDWLVSLGIPSNHMVIVPGSGADDVIKFNLIK